MSHIVICSVSWDAVPPGFLVDWTKLLISCQQKVFCGWKADISCFFSHGSLLPHARNRAIAEIAKDFDDFTHVLFIDSDVIGLTADHVQRLLDHDVDIVCPCVPLGGDPNDPACEHDDEYKAVHAELKKDNPSIVKRRWVGTGCVLIKRHVFEKLAIMCENDDGSFGKTWYRTGTRLRHGWDRSLQRVIEDSTEEIISVVEKPNCSPGDFANVIQEIWLNGFKSNENGIPSGEDIEFGERAYFKGIHSYIDCGIKLRHIVEREASVGGKLSIEVMKSDN